MIIEELKNLGIDNLEGEVENDKEEDSQENEVDENTKKDFSILSNSMLKVFKKRFKKMDLDKKRNRVGFSKPSLKSRVEKRRKKNKNSKKQKEN